jgi:hypothetical protein
LKTRSWRIGYAGGSGIPVSARRWRRRRNGTGIGGCGEGFAGRRKKCVGPGAQQPTLRPILSSNWALPTDVLWKGPLAIPQEKEDQVQSTQFLAYTIPNDLLTAGWNRNAGGNRVNARRARARAPACPHLRLESKRRGGGGPV